MPAAKRKTTDLIDRELDTFPPELRWREWMLRAEAIIFASPVPVPREVIGRVVGQGCSVDLLIDDLKQEMNGRAFELVEVAGGWHYRTRPRMAEVIRASGLVEHETTGLNEHESLVLVAIAYFQPVTRTELSRIFGKEVSRDTIGALRQEGLIDAGPRSPVPGAPYTYVTTAEFLNSFGMNTLRDLPDFEKLEDAGLLSKAALLAEPTIVESLLGEDLEVD